MMALDDEQNVLQRVESLYLEDGDIALSAPSSATPGTSLVFRIDKIFLRRRSAIFRDMLSFSPGNGPNDVYDGVPLVRLADDGEDMARLLGGIYDIE